MAEIICPKLTINGVETNEYNGQIIKYIHYNGNDYKINIQSYDPILENNTWEEIKTACESGDSILSTWLGQTKSTTFNGASTSFRLVDTYVGRYKFDDNSDSHAVFEMTSQTNTTCAWGSSSAVGYVGSNIKSYYDNTNYGLLTNDIQAILKNTTIKSIKGGTNSPDVYDATNCKIFPASVVEMFGADSRYDNETNGGQFAYYIGKSDSARIKSISGGTHSYWLRTPRSHDSANTNGISSSGSNDSMSAGTSRRGSVCFAL